jgi:hypothetical protein
MIPIAGSAYTYAYTTRGEFTAWIIGWVGNSSLRVRVIASTVRRSNRLPDSGLRYRAHCRCGMARDNYR